MEARKLELLKLVWNAKEWMTVEEIEALERTNKVLEPWNGVHPWHWHG